MKKVSTITTVFAALALPLIGVCSYPTEEEAKAVFKLNEAGRACILPCDDEVRQLFRRMQEPSTPDISRSVESVVLDGLKKIIVHVSTNAVDDSVGIDALKMSWVWSLNTQLPLVDFSTNALACLSLAEYVGSVTRVDFPSDLAVAVMTMPIMVSLNGKRISSEHRQQLELENLRRKELRRQLGEKCELQIRVFNENCLVEGYRKQLLSLCSLSVAGCKDLMSTEEFAVFTNQVVKASGASKEEQRVLFRRLHDRYMRELPIVR